MTEIAPVPLPAWWLHACLYRYVGAAQGKPRPKDVPHLTKPAYDWVFLLWAEFDTWNAWVNGGKKAPRPAVWHKVPDWAWTLRGWILAAKPPPPPPPPPHPEPVSPWKDPPWKGLGIHVTWGFRTGDWTPQELADKIATTRIKWAAVEGIPEGYGAGETGNEKYLPDFQKAMAEHGRKVGIWERADVTQSATPADWAHVQHMIGTYNPAFYGADVEVFPLLDPSIPTKVAKEYPNLPRIAIVAGMAEGKYYADYITAGWDCMTEAYAANIGQPPVPGVAGGTDNDAFWRGFPRNFVPAPKGWGGNGSGPHTVPILECNAEGNPGLRVQLPAVAAWGDNWSIWNAEQMQDDDWAVVS